MKKQTTKLRFSEADLESPGIRKAAEKAEKAVEKADEAKARLPSGTKLRTKKASAEAEGAKLRFGKKEITEEIKRRGLDVNRIGPIPLFDRIASAGNIPLRDMYNTFNMGIGMVLTVPAAQVDEAMGILKACGEDARVIGEIVPGEERVALI